MSWSHVKLQSGNGQRAQINLDFKKQEDPLQLGSHDFNADLSKAETER